MFEGKPAHILLVEDDLDHLELIKLCLSENHVANELHHAANGQDALAYLRTVGLSDDEMGNPRPHLILLDLNLPKMNGLELVRRIKSSSKLKSIPVVVLTTSDDDLDVQNAYDGQVNGYLVKPLDFEKFRAMIRDLDFYWCVWNRSPDNN